MNDIKFKAIRAYIRASTLKQDLSPEHQLETIKNFVKFKGYEEIPLHIYTDLGITGSSDERTQYQKLLNDVQSGELVISYALSRISRSVKHTIEFFNTLQRKNAFFCSLSENGLDNQSAIGKFFINLLSNLNEFELGQIQERTRNSLARLARSGKLRRRPPYGYKVAKDEFGNTIKGTTFERVEEEQQVIEKIKHYYEKEMMSLTQIARRLNLENIPCRKANDWKTANVKNVLLREGLIDMKIPK